MSRKKGVSPSLRWSVFARDGFACRYCGAQAGQEGVELCADHVLSEVEGGQATYDNLVTACNKCNGGKGARSLKNAPASTEVIERINERTRSLKQQAKAIAACIQADKDAQQEAVNLKCAAYGVESVRMESGEKSRILSWSREFGADRVLEFYSIAHRNRVPEWKAVMYVSGIVRNVREKEAAALG